MVGQVLGLPHPPLYIWLGRGTFAFMLVGGKGFDCLAPSFPSQPLQDYVRHRWAKGRPSGGDLEDFGWGGSGF